MANFKFVWQIFIVVNGQISKISIATWSHWSRPTWLLGTRRILKLFSLLSCFAQHLNYLKLFCLISASFKEQKTRRLKVARKGNKLLGSRCGSVGRALATNTLGPQFKSDYRQNFIMNIFTVNCCKDKIKKKEAGRVYLYFKRRSYCCCFCHLFLWSITQSLYQIFERVKILHTKMNGSRTQTHNLSIVSFLP